LKRLIVTADDFGLARSVNEAVEEGHRRGILTAASLMVTGEAAEDAVARAKRMPRLGVGLHLVLVDGAPVLPPERVPDLVGSDGRFPNDVFALGVRIFCRPAARRQVAAEIRAQLEAFQRTGLALDHVNAHHHFHLHPTVQRELLRLAPQFGVKAIRVPLEPRFAAWRAGSLRPR
jgi:hopanoid biosynthesis associated protein HpnK